ncbi:MAG: hypothetical protein Q7T82_19605 [Armatimonadota bacterium]|nr:hypothetical protein [Armatimonadota bacterium]
MDTKHAEGMFVKKSDGKITVPPSPFPLEEKSAPAMKDVITVKPRGALASKYWPGSERHSIVA